jgi:gliding motility-associated-like protein
MYIYSRWGQQVFESNDIGLGWDGTINGKPAPIGAYVWIIFYDIEQEGSQERIAHRGTLVLVR